MDGKTAVIAAILSVKKSPCNAKGLETLGFDSRWRLKTDVKEVAAN